MRELFEQEYKKHERSLFLIAAGYLHNTEDAKDILQESALAAYKNFGSLRHREYFKTWITRIVINRCKNFLKGRRYTEELTDNLNAFESISETDIEIMEAICRLNSKTAVYITLRFYNDMTYTEVAKVLKQPVSSVKYRTKKALEELKLFLKGDESE